MGLINVDCLKPGMVLESDLMTPDGRFILSKGAELDEKHIWTCKARGVNQADIVGHNQEQANADIISSLDPMLLRESRFFLSPYLKDWDLNHPCMNEIVRIATLRTAQNIVSLNLLTKDDNIVLSLGDNGAKKIKARKWDVSASDLVKTQNKLISLPDIFFKIVEVMDSPFSSASHIADVVSKDSSLSARLLKLVNSALYAFPSKVDSISRAVAILGTKELTSLAMGVSVVRAFKGVSEKLFNMEVFWKYSIGTGILAGHIASCQQGLSTERFFVAGLLHDIGRLVMIKCVPAAFVESVNLAKREMIPVYQAEKKILGFDHAYLGGLLCREWKLPVVLEEMIRYHHEPSEAKNIADPAVIHLANILDTACSPGDILEAVIPPLDEDAWESIGINPSDLLPVVQQSDRKINEIIRIFLGRELANENQ